MVGTGDVDAGGNIGSAFGVGRLASGLGQVTGGARGGFTGRDGPWNGTQTGLALMGSIEWKRGVEPLEVRHMDVSEPLVVEKQCLLGGR